MQNKTEKDTQTRLHLKVSDGSEANVYASVNFAMASCVIKNSIASIAEKYNLSKATIQLLLFIKSMGGCANIYSSRNILGVHAIHYYYEIASHLIDRGYLKNERSKSSGRYKKYNYILTVQSELLCDDFHSLCMKGMKSFLYY